MNLNLFFASVAISLIPHLQLQESSPLDSSDQRIVRNLVYGKKPIIRPIPFDILTELEIPSDLDKVYKRHPDDTIKLLLIMIEGGNPDDSVLSATYAIALLKGPKIGPVCFKFFDSKIYDEEDKNWKMTPRQHWIKNVKEVMERK